MRRTMLSAIGMSLLMLGVAPRADAQSRRSGAMPARPAPAPPEGPANARNDGPRVDGNGRRYDQVIRSCASYSWPSGLAQNLDRAPQGGSASSPPGARGLPAAPDLPPSRVGTTRMSGTAKSAGSLKPLHSGWRTGDRVCYVRDGYGRLHLIYL